MLQADSGHKEHAPLKLGIASGQFVAVSQRPLWGPF
jgi:hypothetical protein